MNRLDADIGIEHDPSLQTPAPDTVTIRAPLDTMPASSFSSTNVHSALYDFGDIRLYVRYKRDGPDAIYQYADVPASIWQGLVNAGSKGSFINANIAFEFSYSKLGLGDFPDRGRGLESDLARRFVTTP